MRDLYLGMMSGTSVDGIDAVLASFGDRDVDIVASHQYAYPGELQQRLRAAIAQPSDCGVDETGELDSWVGKCFRDAALALLKVAGVSAADVRAIGSHGQTLRHRPDAPHRFTLQIGDPNIIATGTGIATVADFRRADVALGGQGAPLVPPFHNWLFHTDDERRAVVNIGGIANVTVLAENDADVRGFDTGPGNTLLDAWTRRHKQQAFDRDGRWAASGTVDLALLDRWLDDPWFAIEPPKSTGVEYFNLHWLQQHGIDTIDAKDAQATLCELTAASISAAIDTWAVETSQVYVCGGGAHNRDLMQRLARRLGERSLTTTSPAGLDPDWVEAAAFAWLAKRRIDRLPGNLPSVTGAQRPAVLGAIHYSGEA